MKRLNGIQAGANIPGVSGAIVDAQCRIRELQGYTS